jgi:uncharacterized protein with HEPN domain
MSPSANELLRHILDEIDYLLQQKSQATREQLLSDGTLQRAFSRSIEIIGEAAKQMPQEFRASNAALPRKQMSGMRDRLIHGYFAVDYEIVWDVVENKLPALRPLIADAVKRLQDEMA